MPSPFYHRDQEEIDLIEKLYKEGKPLVGTRDSVAVQLRQLRTKQGKPYTPLNDAERRYWEGAGGKSASRPKKTASIGVDRGQHGPPIPSKPSNVRRNAQGGVGEALDAVLGPIGDRLKSPQILAKDAAYTLARHQVKVDPYADIKKGRPLKRNTDEDARSLASKLTGIEEEPLDVAETALNLHPATYPLMAGKNVLEVGREIKEKGLSRALAENPGGAFQLGLDALLGGLHLPRLAGEAKTFVKTANRGRKVNRTRREIQAAIQRTQEANRAARETMLPRREAKLTAREAAEELQARNAGARQKIAPKARQEQAGTVRVGSLAADRDGRVGKIVAKKGIGGSPVFHLEDHTGTIHRIDPLDARKATEEEVKAFRLRRHAKATPVPEVAEKLESMAAEVEKKAKPTPEPVNPVEAPPIVSEDLPLNAPQSEPMTAPLPEAIPLTAPETATGARGGAMSDPLPSGEAPAASIPTWVTETVDRLNDQAEKLGIADMIEEYSAQGRTAKEISQFIRSKMPPDSDSMDLSGIVRAVRNKRGIPSLDEPEEFQRWLNTRNQKQTGGASGEVAPEPSPPSNEVEGLDRLLNRMETNDALNPVMMNEVHHYLTEAPPGLDVNKLARVRKLANTKFGVEPMTIVPGEAGWDPKLFTSARGTEIPTDDPALHLKVANVLRGGFVDASGNVVQKAEVQVYRHEPSMQSGGLSSPMESLNAPEPIPTTLPSVEPVTPAPAEGATSTLRPDRLESMIAKLDLDPTGERSIRDHVASLGLEAKGEVVPLEEQARQARKLADELRIDRNTLGDEDLKLSPEAAAKMGGVEINAKMNLVRENTSMIVEASRMAQDTSLPAPVRQQALDLTHSLTAQNDHLLSQVVTARSQKGRDLGSLRLLANQSDDPEVWMVAAKRALGPERPLTEEIQTRIHQLANAARKACE